jgi:transcriptional regulator with XRE-family HTH domain
MGRGGDQGSLTGTEPATPSSPTSDQLLRARLELGRRLRILRDRAGLSQQTLAERIAYSRARVSDAETAHASFPDRAFWRRCDDVLAARGALVRGCDDFLAARAQRRHDLRSQATLARRTEAAAAYARDALDESAATPRLPPTDTDEVKRRQLLQALASVAALGPADRHGGEVVRRNLELHAPSDVGDRDIDEWERTAAGYADEVAAVSPAVLLPQVLADISDVSRVLGGRVPGRARQRLLSVAGTLSAVAAVSSISTDQPQAARRWWRTARRLSEQSGDVALSAFVASQQAMLSLYTSHSPAVALALAEEAVTRFGGVDCPGTASALAARAQALAVLGRPADAVSAMAPLHSVFERLPADVTDNSASWFAYPEHTLRHTESFVYTYGGRRADALDAQDRVLTLYPAHKHRSRAQVQLHRAACLVLDGATREGLDHAATTMTTLPAAFQGDHLIQRIAHTVLAVVPSGAERLESTQELQRSVRSPALTPLMPTTR